MNDQPSMNENPEPLDRHEARRQRRAERWADPSHGGTWITGLILILLGGLFLLRNMGINIPFDNWWALFILIPAIGALGTAWRMYQNADNQLTAPARGSLFVGLILLMVTAMFLFNISWTLFGPVILILAGIGILINATLK